MFLGALWCCLTFGIQVARRRSPWLVRVRSRRGAGRSAANGSGDGERIPIDLVIDNLTRIVRATDLSVTVDIESGYGHVDEEVW